jgi:hypothetical protein
VKIAHQFIDGVASKEEIPCPVGTVDIMIPAMKHVNKTSVMHACHANVNHARLYFIAAVIMGTKFLHMQYVIRTSVTIST